MQKDKTEDKRRGERSARGMGALYKRIGAKFCNPTTRGNGTFYLFYQGSDGRRVKLRLVKDGAPVTDIDTAKAEQARLRMASVTGDRIEILKRNIAEIQELEDKMAIAQANEEPPLRIADAWDKWREIDERETGKGTLIHYLGAWRKFCAWCDMLNIKALYEVTPEHAKQYIQMMKEAKWRPNTINHHLTFFKGFFKAMQEVAKLSGNPFANIRKLRPDVISRRVLTMDELQAILDKSQGELHTLFLIGMCTGMRLEDCALLQWHEVDLMRGIIRHQPYKTRHSSGAVVVLGIPAILKDELSSLDKKGAYILPTIAAKYSGNGQTTLTKQIQQHLRDCGIETTTRNEDGRIVTLAGFHSLRHTWVSLQAMAGTPQAVIQASAGHSNPAMTEHYTHISEEAAKRAADNLPFGSHSGKADSSATEILRAAVIRAAENADAETLKKMIAAII